MVARAHRGGPTVMPPLARLLARRCLHVAVDMQRLFARADGVAHPGPGGHPSECAASRAPCARAHGAHPFRPCATAGGRDRCLEGVLRALAFGDAGRDGSGAGGARRPPARAGGRPPASANKSTHSAFNSGDFPDLVGRSGAEVLVLSGVETDVCVLGTALGRHRRGPPCRGGERCSRELRARNLIGSPSNRSCRVSTNRRSSRPLRRCSPRGGIRRGGIVTSDERPASPASNEATPATIGPRRRFDTWDVDHPSALVHLPSGLRAPRLRLLRARRRVHSIPGGRGRFGSDPGPFFCRDRVPATGAGLPAAGSTAAPRGPAWHSDTKCSPKWAAEHAPVTPLPDNGIALGSDRGPWTDRTSI